MANECAITGKKTTVGGKYSNRARANQYNPTGKHTKKPNLQKKTVYVPEIDESFHLTVSAKGLKIIQKKGPYQALKDADIIE